MTVRYKVFTSTTIRSLVKLPQSRIYGICLSHIRACRQKKHDAGDCGHQNRVPCKLGWPTMTSRSMSYRRSGSIAPQNRPRRFGNGRRGCTDCALHRKAGMKPSTPSTEKRSGSKKVPLTHAFYNLSVGEALLLLYVDDSVLVGLDTDQVWRIIELLKETFDTVVLGDVNLLFDIGIEHGVNAGTIHQTLHARSILKKRAT